jgi:glutathione S-transferase
MITLYTFGPYFGLPDGSPFVVKAMLLLKLAGLDYREDRNGYMKAPKGKLPYIDDDGTVIADSTLIRFHIERKYAFDFDAGYSREQRGIAWSVEKMLEDHLYWAIIDLRWCDKENFARGPKQFFAAAPAPLRPVIGTIVRRRIAGNLKAHGLGRHGKAEIETMAICDLDAVAGILGDRTFLLGPTPCGADAAMFGMVSGVLAPVFRSPIRDAAEGHANLVAYRDRLLERYFAGRAA